MRKPAVFLDRDGVLNNLVPDPDRGVMDSPLTSDDLTVHRHASGFVRSLNQRGFLVLVVTDQPAVAQGRLTLIGLSRIHQRLRESVAAAGGRIDGIHYCPHDPQASTMPERAAEFAVGCRCKKPAPGLIFRAAQLHNADLHRSYMVCRNLKDVKAGRAAALETVLLTDVRMLDIEAPPELRPHHAAAKLADVLRIIDLVRQSQFDQ